MSSATPPRLPEAASLANPAMKAAVLAEAVPYLRRYAGKTIVVKYGGHAMGAGGEIFARDIALLIPKVETCLAAIGDGDGVEGVVILDGRVPHAILLEPFTEGVGTLIRGS